MLNLKSQEEVEKIRESSLLVGKTLAEIAKVISPGVKTIELDRLAETCIRDHGAVPAFKGYQGYPYSLCVSVNAQVVHGIPGEYELQEGDIVSVDCGVLKAGYFGDSAYTFHIGELKPEIMNLLKVTKESLYKGISMAVTGKRVGDISDAIQSYIENFGYTAVRELVGHGIGKNLHESPEVPNFGRRGTGPQLQEGLVIAIEPMINMGKRNVIQEKDGWTIRTADGLPSAHFEHTVVVRSGMAEQLSTFDLIEEVLRTKNELVV